MAIIDNKPYKLDVYNYKISNNIYKCASSERACKQMIAMLVFYDREAILKKHSDSIQYKDAKYDISDLEPIPFLESNQKVEKVVPLDKNWLGVFISDKKTGKLVEDKLMYVSPEGEGYMTDDAKPALEGCVPDYVYFQYEEDSPSSYTLIDEKYLDGTHDEFLHKLYETARKTVTNFVLRVVVANRDEFENKSFANQDDISLEDIGYAITTEFSKRERGSDFDLYRAMDLMFSFFGGDKIIELERKVNERHLSEQEKEEIDFLKTIVGSIDRIKNYYLVQMMNKLINKKINKQNIHNEEVDEMAENLFECFKKKSAESSTNNLKENEKELFEVVGKVVTILNKNQETNEQDKAQSEPE